MPQELLPIMPPRVQRLCVAGSGPKVRWCCSACVAQVVEHHARLDAGRACASGSIARTWFRYFDKSMTTATLQHCPARLVPPPAAQDRGAIAGGRVAMVRDHVVSRRVG